MERANALHEECFALCRELGAKGFISYCLESLACVAVAESESERAARLFGAAQVLRDTLGISLAPDFRTLVEPYAVEARSGLEAATWEAAFAEGQSMGPEEAVMYAPSENKIDPATDTMRGQPSADAQVAALTRREREIATLVARGMTNRQIAADLTISEHTAATHVRRILKKLGLRSRAQIGSRPSEQQGSAQT